MNRWNKKKLQLKYKMVKEAHRVEESMHNIVAIDTGTLDESIKTFQSTTKVSVTSVQVGSEGIDYAPYVDKLKNETKNYHRHKQVVHTGKGQNFLKRAVEIARPQIDGIKLRPHTVNTYED